MSEIVAVHISVSRRVIGDKTKGDSEHETNKKNHWRIQGRANPAMAPPKTSEGWTNMSFGPTQNVMNVIMNV